MAQTEFRTLNNLVAVFDSVASRHLQINDFQSGQDSEVEGSKALVM